MPPHRADESALILRAKAGDPGAVRALLDRVEDFILAHAARLRTLHSAADALDLAQEGRMAVARCVSPFEIGRVKWITYAGTAALRAMHQAAERAARDADRLPVHPDPDAADPDAYPEPVRSDLLVRVDDLLSRLDPLSREALEIWYGLGTDRGYTYADVARRMGLSAARARALVRAALASLRGSAAGEDTIE